MVWQSGMEIHSHQSPRWIKSLWRKIKLYLHEILEIAVNFQSMDFQWMQADVLNFIKSITSLNDKIILTISVWCYYWKMLYLRNKPKTVVLWDLQLLRLLHYFHTVKQKLPIMLLKLCVPWVVDVALFFNEVKLFSQLYHNILQHN